MADGHGDGGDVAEGFAADVVEVVEVVRVEFREAVDVVADAGVEEEGAIGFDFCAKTFLDFGVGGEEVQGPADAGGGGVVAGAEEGHYLVAHGFEGEGCFTCGFLFHVVFYDESDDVFVFGVGLLVFLTDDVIGFANYYVASGEHVAVHLCGEVFGQGDECGEAVEHARADVEGEDETVSFADGGFGVLEGVEIGAEACFADYVEGGAVEPFEYFDSFGTGVFEEHVSLPELGEEESFAPEDGRQCLDGLNREAWCECLSLRFVWVAFCEQDAHT